MKRGGSPHLYSDDMSDPSYGAADARDVQRKGDRPTSVEAGMLLCRPADGWKAAVLRVTATAGSIATVVTVLADGSNVLSVDLAVAAIVHPDGGWVLAADWTETKEGER